MVPVQSKVCTRSIAGIVDSNPTGGMEAHMCVCVCVCVCARACVI